MVNGAIYLTQNESLEDHWIWAKRRMGCFNWQSILQYALRRFLGGTRKRWDAGQIKHNSLDQCRMKMDRRRKWRRFGTNWWIKEGKSFNPLTAMKNGLVGKGKNWRQGRLEAGDFAGFRVRFWGTGQMMWGVQVLNLRQIQKVLEFALQKQSMKIWAMIKKL